MLEQPCPLTPVLLFVLTCDWILANGTQAQFWVPVPRLCIPPMNDPLLFSPFYNLGSHIRSVFPQTLLPFVSFLWLLINLLLSRLWESVLAFETYKILNSDNFKWDFKAGIKLGILSESFGKRRNTETKAFVTVA